MVSPAKREEWLNQKPNVNPLRLSGRKEGGWDILGDVGKDLQRDMNRTKVTKKLGAGWKVKNK